MTNIIKLKKRPLKRLAGLAITAIVWQLASLVPTVSAAAGGAVISASIAPTTVTSGATEEFDLTISNAASATENISTIIVARTLGFDINSASIQCPFGWTLSTSSLPDSFTCTAGITIFGSADINPGNTEHVIFTATAPEVTEDADTSWNLYFQDSDGGEYESPDVAITITASGTVTPPATGTTTGAVISASIAPTSVASGTTTEFDLAVSNGASASTSIATVMVARVLGFSIDAGNIECPSGWALNTSSLPESFLCNTADTSIDIDSGGTTHIIFTATAPTVTSDVETMWSLYFQDSENGEYNSPDVSFTLLASGTTTGTTTPPTNGTTTPTNNAGTATATSTPTITLRGDATVTAFDCNGFVEPGFEAQDSSGAAISVTSTSNINLDEEGTYTVTYTATDAQGHTATATRTVIVVACSTGGGGSSSDSSGQVLGAFTEADTSGQLLGLAGFDNIFLPSLGVFVPGQVIGGFTFPFFTSGQVLGAFTGPFSGMVLGAFVSDMAVGSRGAEVIELQTRLTMLGYYSGPITGYFGQLTKAAVIRFQAAHGLPSTGFVGPLTRQMLNS